MKNKRRRRYKKKKYDFFLISKIALIGYLAIFGVGYMSSDTSAYLSSQSEISQTITAGFWENPKVLNGCGEEYTIDEVTGEKIIVDSKGKDGNPIEESEEVVLSSSENGADCEDKEADSKETDATEELVCKGKDEILVGENEMDAALGKEVKADCKDKDDEPKEEIQKEKVPEDLKTIEPIIKKQNEIETEENVADKVTVDDPQKSNDESQKETDLKDESVRESKDENSTEKNSTQDEASANDEITDAVK